jgi:SDR family mycofactocin-dependent oxidoreductase
MFYAAAEEPSANGGRGMNMGLLDGKVALITGAARGQGRAHATTCAREGADVIVLDIAQQISTVPYKLGDASDLAETVAEVESYDRRAVACVGDVRSQAALDEAVRLGIAEFGKIDILIANAGIWSRAPFWEITEQEWSDSIEVNLGGAWRAAKAVAPHMIERQSGSIVITSSMNGLEAGVDYAHYISAKHGAIGLAKSIALELGPHGIRCNCVCPGAIKTGMVNHQAAWDMFAGHPGATEEEMMEVGHSCSPLKDRSFLSPQVVADTALYLNSSLADSVTGVVIPVDAGHAILPGINMNPSRS